MEEWSQSWKVKSLDVLIMPAFHHVAYKLENADKFNGTSYYQFMANLLNVPAGVLTVGKVKEGEDEVYEDGINDSLSKVIRRDIKGSVGMPLSVQVVGERWKDELVLGVMNVIEDAFKRE